MMTTQNDWNKFSLMNPFFILSLWER